MRNSKPVGERRSSARIGHRAPSQVNTLAAYVLGMTVVLAMFLGYSRIWASEPVPSGMTFYNRTGVVVSNDLLRFASAGWNRGRDHGFALALQKNTSYFYLWIQTPGGLSLGRNLFCDGNLADRNGAPVRVDSIVSFTLGDLQGNGSIFIIAVSDGGMSLSAWNISGCKGQANVTAAARLSVPASEAGYTIRGDLLAGDFDGVGKDLVQTVSPDSGEMMQWSLDPSGFRLVRRAFLPMEPDSTERIRGISYVVLTKIPHDRDNVAYESATIILHEKGVTIARNDKAITFAPNCRFRPAACANKTLVFNLDQGFTDGLQDLARKDRKAASDALDRIIATLRVVKNSGFTVWALINPIQEDREATIFVLDKLALENIPFVLDYYSSDVTNLAYIKKGWLDYKPRAYSPLKGLSLDVDGRPDSPGSLDFYGSRYGSKFVGLRQLERLGIDIATKDPSAQPMIADLALAKRELSFDWQVARRALEWASDSGRYVIWSDPALYIPYECYSSRKSVQRDVDTRDQYVEGEARLAARYPALVPMYNNNEGLKRCGVAYGDWIMTPRNFRLIGWERIPAHIASLKRGMRLLTSEAGFGLSDQSWTSDYDSILSAGTLPPEEIAIWALDGFSKGAAMLEFEPSFYFFAWPAAPGLTQSVSLNVGQHVGDARFILDVLFWNLGIGAARHSPVKAH